MLSRRGIFNQSPHNHAQASKSVPLEGAGRFNRDRAQRAVPRLEPLSPRPRADPCELFGVAAGTSGAVGRGGSGAGLRALTGRRTGYVRLAENVLMSSVGWAGVRARPETTSTPFTEEEALWAVGQRQLLCNVWPPGREASQVERGQQAAHATGKNQTGGSTGGCSERAQTGRVRVAHLVAWRSVSGRSGMGGRRQTERFTRKSEGYNLLRRREPM